MLESKTHTSQKSLDISDEQLDLILNKHPYFQLGLLEKSKRLRRENHIDSLRTTRKCAILHPDRALLYQSLQVKDEQVEEQQDKNQVEHQAELKKQGNQRETTEKEIHLEATANPKEKEESRSRVESDDELKQNILAEAINQSIQLEAEYYDINSLVKKEDKSSHPSTSKKVLSFSDWISGSESVNADHLDKNLLIDKFIQENPQINRLSDQAFYSPIEKGKESISEKRVPYTETLARIFVQQGNKTLAIKAYEYLMLKNPQKSVYFADLIKKLEE